MNSKQLEEKGYVFAGLYIGKKDKVKLETKKQRQKGLRACISTKTFEGIKGYSIYVKNR